MTRGCIVIFSL